MAAAATTGSALPLVIVTGMAFEARIAAAPGVEVVYAARADRLQHALEQALARGAAGVMSFGTAGGLSPDLLPGAIVVADAIDGPAGRRSTDVAWSERIASALRASLPAARIERGPMAAVAAPVVTRQQKETLHRETGALAVDMESHIASEQARARGLPFAVCRAIVDPAWRTLPPAATAGLREDGTTALGPILCELARGPGQLPAMIRLAFDARAARASLVAARAVLLGAGALSVV
ncbi:phosphorylase [Trinickia dinghuensis]|uniref:Phosphorylase n=1 Tax=Trinickia dinghuensis TaxID=2291023 RepID=A0A3D8K6B0_9BURK|nr:phosphorylase [Trinickia dinghuensis]RDV00751.1 phosphorylase [Trinickia dinghuensis]